MSYFVGRGDVYIATKDAVTGLPQGFSFLGNCPELAIQPNDALTRFATGASLITPSKLVRSGQLPTFDLTLDEVLKENLGLFTSGKHSLVPGSSVSENITAKVGKFIPVQNINLTSLEVVGYTESVDYVRDLQAGGVTILSTGSIVEDQVLTVNTTFSQYNKVGMHTTAQPYYWLRLNGINVGDDSNPVVVDMFKVKLGVPDKLVLIGDDFASMSFKGKMYYDDRLPDTEEEGRILRIRSVL